MSKESGTPRWLRGLCGRRPWTAEQARRVLDEQEASGETVGEFASRVGLVAQRLYWWRDRLSVERTGVAKGCNGTTAEASSLVPMTVRLAESAQERTALAPVEVTAAQGAEVRVMVNDLSATTALWVAMMVRSLHEARS